MKKYLIIVFTMLTCGFCFGQQPRFQLYIKNACTGIEQLDTSYSLSKITDNNTSYFPKKGTVYLPGPGKYLLFKTGPFVTLPVIEIKDTSLFVLRHAELKLQLYETGAVDALPAYAMCDTLINGYAEDFYANGKVRIRGVFKHGYPQDSLVTFYPNGKLERRTTRLKKAIVIEDRDSLGNLIKLSRKQRGSFMTYLEHQWIVYYPNGTVKQKLSSKKMIEQIEEFDSTGVMQMKQTAKSRKEYYPGGAIKMNERWTIKRDGRMTDFKVHTITYNITGQVVRKSVTEYWNSYQPQPDLQFSKSNWVLSMRKYKDGKEISRLENMETQKYLEKYPEEK